MSGLISASELVERAAKISVLVLDVDGVLTDGSVIYDDRDGELKRFHVRDGSGLKFWRDLGNRAAIISGRSSSSVDRRAKELGISPVLQGRADKSAALDELLGAFDIRPEQICAIGDDLPDWPLLRRVGLSVAVADGAPELRQSVHHVTVQSGGRGAVREAIEWLLTLRGQWDDVVKQYSGTQRN